ncbi:MAG: hypothetical protein G01um101433_120 [Parcubacteria group bacterium Gr01-1014_33]|nr:MAG: hypothetical protein G01um101433_120 [Parcubacteria group bacterium Gr01-1014_33]
MLNLLIRRGNLTFWDFFGGVEEQYLARLMVAPMRFCLFYTNRETCDPVW